MASSEDFKKYIQAGKLTEALALAMGAAVKLQITTRVLGDEDMATGHESQPGERIRTQINMVEGQITNEIGEQFTGKNPYKDLKQVHLEQVKEGAKTIQNNLKSLQKLFRLLVAMRQQNLLEVTPIDVTPTSELNAEAEQSILLPPMGGYEAISNPESAELVDSAAHQREQSIPLPDASVDNAPASEEIATSENLISAPELDSELAAEKPEINPLIQASLLATAGTATVAIAAAMAEPNKAESVMGGRSVDHESLADLEPEDKPKDEADNKYDDYDEYDEEDQGDATVIQLSTVAYSSAATYVPVPPPRVPENAATIAPSTSESSLVVDNLSPDPAEENALDLSHEDWDDFGENLPVETVSQIPHNAAEVMSATLEATLSSPDVSSPDLSSPDLSSPDVSSHELSSFADAQEAAWEDDWEDEPEAIDLSRQMPPVPPIVRGYADDDDYLDLDTADPVDMDDSSWDDVEEEFKYVSSPTGKDSRYANLDDDFEMIGEIIDTPESPSSAFAGVESLSDAMEDIFGDLDENLLLSHDSGRSAGDSLLDSGVDDDFADFDFDEEPPSPHN